MTSYNITRLDAGKIGAQGNKWLVDQKYVHGVSVRTSVSEYPLLLGGWFTILNNFIYASIIIMHRDVETSIKDPFRISVLDGDRY